jgi:hypothetical protein
MNWHSCFHNTYPPKFYKQLHRYVHAHYNRVKAADQIKKFSVIRFNCKHHT